jgi:phage FluMu gp28-like protein
MNEAATRPREHVLLPYQARWFALNRDGGEDHGRYRWIEKSRQTGVTWTEAARQVRVASSPNGRDCTYVSTSHVLAREYIDTVAMWARAFNRAAGAAGVVLLRDGADDILAHQVRFASGFTVTGISSNPAALRGRRGDVCVDEAAHHMRLEDLVTAAFACTTWGGRISLISTHAGTRNRFNTLGNEIKAGTARGKAMRVDIFQALRDGLFRRICKVSRRPWTAEAEAQFLADCLASPGAEEEFKVNPSEAGSVFYRGGLIEVCSRKGIPCAHLQRPPEWTLKDVATRTADTRAWCDQQLRPLVKGLKRDRMHYAGQDFARKRHLSAIWVLERAHDYTLSTPFWLELRNVPDEEQEIIAEYLLRGAHVGDGQPEVGLARAQLGGYAVDTTEGGGRVLADRLATRWGKREENEAGLIVSVNLNAPWYEREHHRLRQLLEERDLSIPADEGVTADLQSWRVSEKGGLELGPETKSLRDGLPRHGDTSIALLLAQSLAPDVAQPAKYQSLKRPSSRRGRLL